jgi:paraquat-inducible protein A
MSTNLRAIHVELASCEVCEALVRFKEPAPGETCLCPRCEFPVELRKPNSIARTWALVLAAFVMYIPANLFAMMVIKQGGQSESDNILGGVITMINAGWYPVAILIFIASITVPLAKLVSLTGLLISVHLKSHWNPRERAVLYRVVEVIGRWSMLDVFVLMLLIGLVQLGNLMTIEVGRAGTYFAAVVVLTILAARSFDPRLVWDALEDET